MSNKIQKLKIVKLCDLYGALLTEKQEQMLRLFYDYDNSLSEIAEQFGITRQAVHDSIVKGEAQLISLDEKLNLLEKVSKINGIIEEVKKEISQDHANASNSLEQITKIIYGD